MSDNTSAGTGAGGKGDRSPSDAGWYDLFSRGARDWLRHNEKVREAVRQHLPQIVAGADVLSGGASTVRVPVRMLEHYRFKLRSSNEQQGVGQGQAKPGDRIGRPQQDGDNQRGQGGNEDGTIQYTLEFRIDDIVDWLWEEMQLPNLEAKAGRAKEDEWTREGWDRRGARSRLDRRRSMKEAVKRRHAQGKSAPPFSDDDLRFRQLVRRPTPTTQAVVFFAMDVSGSMSEGDRQLAKTFFFWVVQGLRRQYKYLEPVFVAHTVDAWEFQEQEFFQVAGTGGTVASSAFEKVLELVDQRYDPGRYNIYLFYASDGENAPQDRDAAATALHQLGAVASFVGYVEISSGVRSGRETETAALFRDLAPSDAVGSYVLTAPEAVWDAIRRFFADRSQKTGS
jgi:sporulation protein YhbH